MSIVLVKFPERAAEIGGFGLFPVGVADGLHFGLVFVSPAAAPGVSRPKSIESLGLRSPLKIQAWI